MVWVASSRAEIILIPNRRKQDMHNTCMLWKVSYRCRADTVGQYSPRTRMNTRANVIRRKWFTVENLASTSDHQYVEGRGRGDEGTRGRGDRKTGGRRRKHLLRALAI